MHPHESIYFLVWAYVFAGIKSNDSLAIKSIVFKALANACVLNRNPAIVVKTVFPSCGIKAKNLLIFMNLMSFNWNSKERLI